MAFSTPYPTSHPQVFASSFLCRSCNCVLVKIIPSAIVDRLVSCSLYFCHGHVGPESTRPTCQYRALACWGLVALAFASRPDGHEFLSHHHLHAHMLTWQSFLVDLGTVRTFSCSMMNVANNGKNEFSKENHKGVISYRLPRQKWGKWHIEEKGLEWQSS